MGAAKKKTAATFTSGPWEIWGPCNEDSPMQKPCMVVQSTSAAVQVAECVWDHGDGEAKETAIADARLIAQAPAMHALLVRLDRVRADGMTDLIDEASRILAAIEGKS